MIIVYAIILITGFVALTKGASLFVDGSSSLAAHCRVPSLVIGMTIVAFGTSAPELAVSVTAAIQGSNEIALSNVVGSNIVNLLAVLGICAMISPLRMDVLVLKRDFPFGIIITGALLAVIACSFIGKSHLMSYTMDHNTGVVTRITGMILVTLFAGYVCYLIVSSRKEHAETIEGESRSILKCILLIIVGLALIIAGGQAVVMGAKEIARAFGMSETLIGLTVIAVGTSLPEMVTSIVAAKKGETELAIGNVVGSNLFNLMLILGISAMIDPVEVNLASVLDISILLVASILTFIFSLSRKRIGRIEGSIMVGIYVADIAFAVLR